MFTTSSNNYYKLFAFNKRLDEVKEESYDWSIEFNTPPPSETVWELVRNLSPELISREIEPYRIAPTIEEGLCLNFTNGNEKLFLEIYNDGDIGYIIENSHSKTIIENADISPEEIIFLIERFYCL